MNRKMERRRRWSASEWAEHVASWRASGCDAERYAARCGLGVQRLEWWARKLSEEVRAPALVPVQFETEVENEEIGWEVMTGSGDVLRVRGRLTEAMVETVLAALVSGGRRR